MGKITEALFKVEGQRERFAREVALKPKPQESTKPSIRPVFLWSAVFLLGSIISAFAFVLFLPKSPSETIPTKSSPPSLGVVTTPSSGGYTLQVYSFLSSGPAERAVSNLQARGYEAFLIQSPNAIAVCIGNFETVAEAETRIPAIQEIAPDAYVRNR